MKRSRWMLIAILAGAGVLGLSLQLALRSGPLRSGERRGSSEVPAVAEAPASELVPAAEAPAHAVVERSAAARALVEAESRPVASTDASTDARASRALEIVDEAGQPRAQAEVWFRASAGGWEPGSFDEHTEGAQHTRADASGLARIAWPLDQPVLVLAASGELRGGAALPAVRAPDERARVTLHLDWALDVEVLDAAGEPAAGIPVRFELMASNSRYVVDELESDANGRASLAHAGLKTALEGVRSVEVRLTLPLAEPLVHVVECERPPRDLIRFRLPPLGSVVVQLLVPEGGTVPDGTGVRLALVRPGEEREISPFAHTRRAALEHETSDGKVKFALVGLGCEVELSVQRGAGAPDEKTYFPGPRLAGERVEHTWVFERTHSVLVFRALDEQRQLLAGQELELVLRQRQEYMSDEDRPAATTDAEGRFELVLAAALPAGTKRLLLVSAHEGAVGTEVDLTRSFEPGRVAMGDVVLAKAPLLAAGRVHDAAGAPLAGAEIALELPVTDESDGGGGVWYWEDLELELVSDASGAFAARALVPSSIRRVRLAASLQGQVSERLEVDVGASGLELGMLATGSIAGTLLLDRGVPAEQVELQLSRPAAGEAGESERSGREIEADGRFRWQGLLPGVYDLRVGVEDHADLVSVEGLEVRPGEECRDPRLAGIDLRGRLHALVLRLVFAEPQAEARGFFVYRAAGQSEESESYWIRSNPVLLLTPFERLDGELELRGFRTVELRGVSGEEEVELVPALRVRLSLPASVVLPEPPVYVKAALTREDGKLDFGGNPFDQAREITALVPGAGRMKVQWIVEQRSAHGARATTVDIEPAQYVEVVELAGEQRFELTLTSAALARAVAGALE